MNTQRKADLKVITPEPQKPEPPKPGYAYKKKRIPYFEPELIDFAVPSAVKPRLDELKRPYKKEGETPVKERWFDKILSKLK